MTRWSHSSSTASLGASAAMRAASISGRANASLSSISCLILPFPWHFSHGKSQEHITPRFLHLGHIFFPLGKKILHLGYGQIRRFLSPQPVPSQSAQVSSLRSRMRVMWPRRLKRSPNERILVCCCPCPERPVRRSACRGQAFDLVQAGCRLPYIFAASRRIRLQPEEVPLVLHLARYF